MMLRANAFALSVLFGFVAACSVGGCVGAAVNASTLAVKGASRGELAKRAEAGDDVAQYELGVSYCCMGPGFDTQTATQWLCEAARQGNADAMFELGRIYLGDVSRSLAPGQKLMRQFTAKSSSPHAYVWLSRSAELGHEHAAEKLASLTEGMDRDGISEAQRLNRLWPDVECTYDDVFRIKK